MLVMKLIMDQVNPPILSFFIQSVGVCFWLPIIKKSFN